MNRLLYFFLFLHVFSISLFSQDGKLFYHQIFAPQEGLVKKPEAAFRNEICLNGLWDFQAIPIPEGYVQGKGITPDLTPPSDGRWDAIRIKIPSPWNINSFANRNTAGPDHRNYPSYPKSWEDVKMAWMRKTVTVPSEWKDKTLLLHFEAVAGFTEVLVNGKKAGENFDLFLPFDIDITGLANAGETAEILVGVRSQSLFEDRSTLGRRIIPAGSMWGSHISGIWQDVFLTAIPKINIENIYVKPLVSKQLLELEVKIKNNSLSDETLSLGGDIREWINKAGKTINSAPVPNWELASSPALLIPEQKITVPAGNAQKVTVQIPVKEGILAYWTPEFPNLYGLTLKLNKKNTTIDAKYERFGWREWTFSGSKQLLNGKEMVLKGDSWHFMGIPQLTRRYAWAWFTALKDANANAVRPHAQVYPRFYLDVADEMGICVLDETAIWASDGGPKMDSPVFWKNCKEHIRRLVLRDRNHASVFGWSVSNENKPVILNVFRKPEWMPMQKEAWVAWRDTVMKYDPTRPWISSDGEEDGEGILPTTMGHYGDNNSMKAWQSIGKPWGVGEHGMAYYGTPEQVSKYNGERAYESQEGRMEGLANEAYNLISNQRKLGASYVSVFNIVWYGLQPLPFGKKDLSVPPSLENDGIFFPDYKEGQPGVQPERMGPYCSTFNPGYDPALPLYISWPMFDAIKAANVPDNPAWSKWAKIPRNSQTISIEPLKQYKEIAFIGDNSSEVKNIFESQGISFTNKYTNPNELLVIVDGNSIPDAKQQQFLKDVIGKGADCWIWNPVSATIDFYNSILPLTIHLEQRPASSYIPASKSWMRGMLNSDFYFSEIQRENASEYGMSGDFVNEGDVLLSACNTDWRKWNRQPEELKTASTLRSELEAKGADPVFVKYTANGGSTFFVSTLNRFTNTEKGFKTMSKIIHRAGISPNTEKTVQTLLDNSGVLKKWIKNTLQDNTSYSFWIWSPRPLDDLLIEPDIPKVGILIQSANGCIIHLNDKPLNRFDKNVEKRISALPLKQGWNHFQIRIIPDNPDPNFSIRFESTNKPEFIREIKAALINPDDK